MKTECPTEQPQFFNIVGPDVVTRFDGGTLTSDPLLAGRTVTNYPFRSQPLLGPQLRKLSAERLLVGPARTSRRRDSVSSELTGPTSIVRNAGS
jgi:hypothetical protein